ncbi:MAG: hypothetical protein PF692_05060 [Kiritimatiellae bacterium]|jgi:hypothetical protein|nr:hypothetical protein [Kiritimatiellia bacterium]
MNNELDKMLKDWAINKSPDSDHLHDLSLKINEKISSNSNLNVGNIVVRKVLFLQKLLYAGIGAVAAIFIMLLVNAGDTVPSPVDSSYGQIVNSGKLFSCMQELFPDNLRWITESAGKINLGLETHNNVSSSAPLLIRISIVSRERGSKVWKPEWSSDITLRGEELIEIAPTRDDADIITLWVYSLNDGKLAVDTSIKLDTPVRFAVENTNIIKPGESTVLLSLTEEDVEYKVLQTITRLDKNA